MSTEPTAAFAAQFQHRSDRPGAIGPDTTWLRIVARSPAAADREARTIAKARGWHRCQMIPETTFFSIGGTAEMYGVAT